MLFERQYPHISLDKNVVLQSWANNIRDSTLNVIFGEPSLSKVNRTLFCINKYVNTTLSAPNNVEIGIVIAHIEGDCWSQKRFDEGSPKWEAKFLEPRGIEFKICLHHHVLNIQIDFNL